VPPATTEDPGIGQRGEAIVQHRYTALVKGPAAIFPRGMLWLVPAWYAAIAVLLVAERRSLLWYTPAALLGLLVAAVSLLTVLATLRTNAFLADDEAIWLGLRAGAARRIGRRRKEARPLPWAQIEQVKIRPRLHGARLEILLGPAAPIVRRPNVAGQIAVAIVLLVLPVSCMVRSPGLLRARRSLPGYRVRLHEVRPEELRKALTALAPETVRVSLIRRTLVPRLRTARTATPQRQLVPR
jgi:hypothetical protein